MLKGDFVALIILISCKFLFTSHAHVPSSRFRHSREGRSCFEANIRCLKTTKTVQGKFGLRFFPVQCVSIKTKVEKCCRQNELRGANKFLFWYCLIKSTSGKIDWQFQQIILFHTLMNYRYFVLFMFFCIWKELKFSFKLKAFSKG